MLNMNPFDSLPPADGATGDLLLLQANGITGGPGLLSVKKEAEKFDLRAGILKVVSEIDLAECPNKEKLARFILRALDPRRPLHLRVICASFFTGLTAHERSLLGLAVAGFANSKTLEYSAASTYLAAIARCNTDVAKRAISRAHSWGFFNLVEVPGHHAAPVYRLAISTMLMELLTDLARRILGTVALPGQDETGATPQSPLNGKGGLHSHPLGVRGDCTVGQGGLHSHPKREKEKKKKKGAASASLTSTSTCEAELIRRTFNEVAAHIEDKHGVKLTRCWKLLPEQMNKLQHTISDLGGVDNAVAALWAIPRLDYAMGRKKKQTGGYYKPVTLQRLLNSGNEWVELLNLALSMDNAATNPLEARVEELLVTPMGRSMVSRDGLDEARIHIRKTLQNGGSL
jgi:hypothetical protein